MTLFPKWNTNIKLLHCNSLDYARDNKSITCFSDLCRPIKNTSMLAPIYTLSSSKAPKRSKFSATNLREKPVDFLWHRTDVDFGSRNNFTNLGSFEKVFVPEMIPKQ